MADIKLGAIKQIALSVKDLDVSVDFYEKTLGLPLLFKADPGMAFFDIAGIRLMLSQAEEVPLGGPYLYFSADDIEATYAALTKAGTDGIRAPLMTHKTDTSELWLAFFKDPDGHTLALMEEKALAPGKK